MSKLFTDTISKYLPPIWTLRSRLPLVQLYKKKRFRKNPILCVKKSISKKFPKTNRKFKFLDPDYPWSNFRGSNAVHHTSWWNHHFSKKQFFSMENTKAHQFLTSIDQSRYHHNTQYCSSHIMVEPSFREKTVFFDEKYQTSPIPNIHWSILIP